ncbi:oxidoreductase, short chain dehydrogenase/reductase family [Shewanella violacea DSS12]|uniref:Oxidoreductase, short chain dehydrogenase/reductase family n=2 Tax=Shewanella violacea TaxID=60217 RepID=D4ZLT0_SHEVD|nr:oxidoreductase, short chain dehydrogenase/reductase family [Shewanella violacea DSS12]
MKMSFDIANKVALVTGANRGIGKSIVESFLAHGAKKVYLAVRDLDSTKELVKQYGHKVSPLLIDVSNAQSIMAAAKIATDVQVVVNNAGVLKIAAPLDEHAEASLTEELNINAFGLLRMAQAFTPILEKNGPAALVQLNSVASIKNFAALTTYSASKAAAYSITQGLKESLGPKNIAVLSVHPGPINTDMAAQGGMTEIAEPTSVVAQGIVTSLKAGDFHLFPDAMARDFQGAYQSYADNIIEADLSE